MNEIVTATAPASVAGFVPPPMSDEQIVAHLEGLSAELVGETEVGLYEAASARIAERQRQEVAAEAARKEAEAARAEAARKAKDAFWQMRHDAATALANKGEDAVAAALRGEGHPVWGKAVLTAFLARFSEGKRGTYHDIVVGTVAEAEAAIAREAEELAEAERIRAEAKRRYERNRADRAERNRRKTKK